MLGMLFHPGITQGPNVWKLWVDYILKQSGLGIRKAALVHHDGSVCFASKGFALVPSDVQGPNVWKLWVDYILKQSGLGIRKAALVHHDGSVCFASKGFALVPSDVQKLDAYLEGTNNSERITLNGYSYIIKDIFRMHLVAFSGSKYYIIAKSKSMYVIAVCDHRSQGGILVND
ncbi:hypothetical protein CAPTEDRAFT_201989 [Capitella teleta]|uniref:Profilin n=1 Tax=Capitella teleta TaxID=283909 RepID=R7V5E9_CAPTE|nr:hypothetical protein CAPTEDRAFT_201989 [Capitella teleta]|eukprot:ELU11581.1 hypothetical protein CAPTEDRAFT_201989 [Capitella teleta]